MRVVTGAINHESSTFTPVQTTWESYRDERFGYLRGEELIEKFAGTTTCIGGFIKAAETLGFELIPTIFANAHPSAPTPRPILDAIVDEMLECIEAAGEVDALLLELHGAMVAEGIDDGEGHILRALRQQVGQDVPILAQLDIHANVSPAMIEQADVLIGRKTYPEIDMVQRSLQCADVLMRMVEEGAQPTMALHRIPLVWGMNQVTDHPPMSELMDKLCEIEDRPEVLCASVATCFPLADIPDMGASVYLATDGDQPFAQQLADELGEWIFARRADWHAPKRNTRECLRQAEADGLFPVIFADRNDNTGGGAPGDSTGVLHTFVKGDLQDACLLYIVDPEAVAACDDAGVGAEIELEVGGKSSPLQGEPVAMQARVVALSDGGFIYDGPRNEGMQGVSVHLPG